MIYIHELQDLGPKTAEIESVPIVRQIKDKLKTSVSEQHLSENISPFFVLKESIELINNSLNLMDPVINEIKILISKNSPVFESINLYRAVSMLEEIRQPLINNIDYVKEIELYQQDFIQETASLFNDILNIKTNEENIELNKKVNLIFQKILRNNDFKFNYIDIIGEGKLNRIKDLHSSLSNGFFFHTTVKEHLDKVSFSLIKERIPREEIEAVNNITKDIFEIKNGIQKAYDINMNMVNLTVILYSYLKCLIK